MSAKPKPKPKKSKKESPLKPFLKTGERVKLKDGTVGIVGRDGRLRDAVTGDIVGGTAGLRKVKRIWHVERRRAKELGAVIDFKDLKDLDFDGEPTLDDLAAFLRPGKKLAVGMNLFKQDESLKPLAGEDGVEYWGWITQNKNQGLMSDWVFVAVQEVGK